LLSGLVPCALELLMYAVGYIIASKLGGEGTKVEVVSQKNFKTNAIVN